MKRSNVVATALSFALVFMSLAPSPVVASSRIQPAEQDIDVPSDAEQSMFTKGQALYNQGHFDQAASVLRDLLKGYPKSIIRDLTLLWLGRSYIQLGQIDEADQVGVKLRSIKDTPFVDIYDNELRAARRNAVSRPLVVPGGGQSAATKQNVPSSDPKTFTNVPTDSNSNSRARYAGAETNSNTTGSTGAQPRLIASGPGSSLAEPKSRSGETAASRTPPLRSNRGRSNPGIVAKKAADSTPKNSTPSSAVKDSLAKNVNSNTAALKPPLNNRPTGRRRSNQPARTDNPTNTNSAATVRNSKSPGSTTSDTALRSQMGTTVSPRSSDVAQRVATVGSASDGGGLSITVRQTANLSLFLRKATETASPGQVVQLPVTVTNNGSGIDRFRLETDVPAEYQPTFSLARNSDAADLPVLITPPLGTGSSTDVVLSLMIPIAAANGSRVPFNVRAFSEADSQMQRVSAGAISIVAATLSAVSNISKSSISPGETFSQNITIQNSGGSSVVSSRADFVFNRNFELVNSVPAAMYDKDSRIAVWNLGDLNPGEQKHITVTVRATSDALAQSIMVGRGRVRSQSLPVQASFDGPKIELSPMPKVRVDAVSLGLTARPGESIYFPFVVRNTGNVQDVYELRVVSPGAPIAVIYADSNGDGQHQPNEPTITQTGQIDPQGGEFPLLVRVEIPANTSDRQQYSYNLVARSISTNKVAGEASSVLTVTMPHVSIRTEQITGSPAPGATIFYRLVVVNDGSGMAKNLTVTENLPEALQLVSTDPAIEQQDSSNSNRIMWKVTELGPGDTAVLRIGVKLKPNLKPDTNLTSAHSITYEDSKGNSYRP
jgi:uncharacterized repeat protein (TIGR01451 family)